MATWDFSHAEVGDRLTTFRGARFAINPTLKAHDGEFIDFAPRGERYAITGLITIATKSTHVATMDADRWLIVMQSPEPLGIPFTRAA